MRIFLSGEWRFITWWCIAILTSSWPLSYFLMSSPWQWNTTWCLQWVSFILLQCIPQVSQLAMVGYFFFKCNRSFEDKSSCENLPAPLHLRKWSHWRDFLLAFNDNSNVCYHVWPVYVCVGMCVCAPTDPALADTTRERLARPFSLMQSL